MRERKKKKKALNIPIIEHNNYNTKNIVLIIMLEYKILIPKIVSFLVLNPGPLTSKPIRFPLCHDVSSISFNQLCVLYA